MASLLIRMVDTKAMWPHMNRPSSSPDALCTRSMRAGQWLLRARSTRPTPAITSLLLSLMVIPRHALAPPGPEHRSPGREQYVAPRAGDRVPECRQLAQRKATGTRDCSRVPPLPTRGGDTPEDPSFAAIIGLSADHQRAIIGLSISAAYQ